MAGVFTIRTVVVSSAPSAAKDGAARTRLAAPASARVALTPAAPANAALVRNRRRLWIGIEHLPDPNRWITMSLARWPIRAVRIEVSARAGVPQDCRP